MAEPKDINEAKGIPEGKDKNYAKPSVNNIAFNGFIYDQLKSKLIRVPNDSLQSDNKQFILSNSDLGGNITNDDYSIKNYSLLGTPVYSYLAFAKGNYTDINDPSKTVYLRGVLLDTVLFNVNRRKNIIETTTIGSQGSVKEYINSMDYEISAECIIIGQTLNDTSTDPDSLFKRENTGNSYPIRDMSELIKYLDTPSPLEVISPYLNDVYGIKNVVIKSFSTSQDEGGYNYQRITIEMVSDTPLELIQV